MALYSAIQKFITKNGAPVVGASCVVLVDGGATQPTLYASRTGGALSNPFLTDSQGNALCFVAPGRYKMIVTKDAEQVTFEGIEVGPVSLTGNFADGGIVSDPDQWFVDAAGNQWAWVGALNKTVAPGEDPTLDADWVLMVDKALRADLNAGAAPIAGEPSSKFAYLVGVDKLTPRESYDLTGILKSDCNIVITGDSLSFNSYDFDSGRTNAYDTYPGIMSWSFMLRDLFYRTDPAFKHWDELNDLGLIQFNRKPIVRGETGAVSRYRFPLNNLTGYAGFQGLGDKLLISYDVPNNGLTNARVYLLSDITRNFLLDVYFTPAGGSRTFHSTIQSGGRAGFRGYEPFFVDIDTGMASGGTVLIEFTNAREIGGSALSTESFLSVQAVGQLKINVYLTGRGGWKTTDFLVGTEFEDRIGQFVPDVLTMIFGANDRASDTKEAYAAGYGELIDRTYEVNPYCKITCLTAMPASDTGYTPLSAVLNGSTMAEFLQAGKEAVESKGAYWFDNYRFFADQDPADWRFDNVHMTKRGNERLFWAFATKFFGGAIKNPQYYDVLNSIVNGSPRTLRKSSYDQILGNGLSQKIPVQKFFTAAALPNWIPIATIVAPQVAAVGASNYMVMLELMTGVPGSNISVVAEFMLSGRISTAGVVGSATITQVGGPTSTAFIQCRLVASGNNQVIEINPAAATDVSVVGTAELTVSNNIQRLFLSAVL